MRGAESIANEDTVAESSELFGEGFVVSFLFGMEAHIFEHEHFAVAQRLALRLRAWTNAIQGESRWFTEEFFQLFGRRLQLHRDRLWGGPGERPE